MNVEIPRRRFLQHTSALTVAAGLPASSWADEPVTMPIVDTTSTSGIFLASSSRGSRAPRSSIGPS